MNTHVFLQKIRQRAAATSESEAMNMACVSLETLGELLSVSDRHRLSAQLPAELAEAVRRSPPAQDFDVDEFYARVARREGVARGFGLEHAQGVCSALAEMLPPPSLADLKSALPDDIAALLIARKMGISGRSFARTYARRSPQVVRTTVATGRPGSARPLSEARVGDMAGLQAQSGSIAASDNPHDDTKLSGARPQSDTGRTLATATPGMLQQPGEPSEIWR